MRQTALGMMILLLSSGPALAGPCESAKLKAAATKAGTTADCHANAVSEGIPVDSICLDKTTAKFSKDVAKADAKSPPCDASHDAAQIESRIDAFIAEVGSELPDPGPSKCAASKWKATGKKAKAKLGCRAKAASKGGSVDPTCLAKAEVKFTTSFAKADAKGPCTGDPVAIEAAVDALVDDIGQCSNPAVPSGAPCDDGIACTGGEFCLNGVCGNGASNCAATDLCHRAGACDRESGECVGGGGPVCPPVDPEVAECWRRFCETSTGDCISESKPADPPTVCSLSECQSDSDCDDGNPCTENHCRGSLGMESCQWSPISCDDGVACTVDSCAPFVGCEHHVETPITFCDDEVACTDDDYAASYPASCDCENQAPDNACDDGDPCTQDVCGPAGCGHPSICDDGLACTTDLCDPNTQQCSHVAFNCS